MGRLGKMSNTTMIVLVVVVSVFYIALSDNHGMGDGNEGDGGDAE